MNAKTWQTLGGFGLPLMMVIGVGVVFGRGHGVPTYVLAACSLAVAVLGGVGAYFGVLLALGRLHFGCPLCGTRSRVTGGTRKDLYLDCPSCGPVRVTSRLLRPATADKVDVES
jgi:hypothetical protein